MHGGNFTSLAPAPLHGAAMVGRTAQVRALLANDDDDIVLTENLEAAPAIILGILFLFVALLCLFKDLAPAILRWAKSRKRVIWFYGLIFVASTGRTSVPPRTAAFAYLGSCFPLSLTVALSLSVALSLFSHTHTTHSLTHTH